MQVAGTEKYIRDFSVALEDLRRADARCGEDQLVCSDLPQAQQVVDTRDFAGWPVKAAEFDDIEVELSINIDTDGERWWCRERRLISKREEDIVERQSPAIARDLEAQHAGGLGFRQQVAAADTATTGTRVGGLVQADVGQPTVRRDQPIDALG